MDFQAIRRAQEMVKTLTPEKRAYFIVTIDQTGSLTYSWQASADDLFLIGARVTQLASTISPTIINQGDLK